MPIITHYPVMLHFLYFHRYLFFAEVRKKPYNHVTRIINRVLDAFVMLIISCIKTSICNFNSTGTLSTMIGYENVYKHIKEGCSCYWEGEWWCSGPGTSTSPWDVTECFPAWLICIRTLYWLNEFNPPRIQTHDANNKLWIAVTC